MALPQTFTFTAQVSGNPSGGTEYVVLLADGSDGLEASGAKLTLVITDATKQGLFTVGSKYDLAISVHP